MSRELSSSMFGKIERKSFSRIKESLEIPNLVEVQKDSYLSFVNEGIAEVFEDYSPITDFSDHFELYFMEHRLIDTPKYSEKECRDRDATYAIPLKVKVRLVNKVKGTVLDREVFMGDIPKMTNNGSFIINGAERVIVSQLVKSPGAINKYELDKSGKKLFQTTVSPNRGAWLEFEQDSQNVLWVKVDRTRKLPATVLLRSLGFGSNESITELFGDEDIIKATLEKDTTKTEKEGLFELYRRLRPGEVPNDDSVKINLRNLFFEARRYDLARVGRYKFDKKLRLSARIVGLTLADDVVDEDGEVIAEKGEVITRAKALIMEDAGINEVYVTVGGKRHKIIANNIASFERVTGVNSKVFSLIDTIH
ncbi:MAG: DNA-directed RNA polymerase subunit beta, partial [Clostridia bacterium]|nr:DNA-directed RNA polymerase subunit beta [Clostridia bacterium]